VYGRQWNDRSSNSGSSSPAHPLSSLQGGPGALSTVKRTQNITAKAAAQRLAQVMASQAPDEDEEEDDLGFRFSTSSVSSGYSNGSSYSGGGFPAISVSRPNRSPSHAVI